MNKRKSIPLTFATVERITVENARVTDFICFKVTLSKHSPRIKGVSRGNCCSLGVNYTSDKFNEGNRNNFQIVVV